MNYSQIQIQAYARGLVLTNLNALIADEETEFISAVTDALDIVKRDNIRIKCTSHFWDKSKQDYSVEVTIPIVFCDNYENYIDNIHLKLNFLCKNDKYNMTFETHRSDPISQDGFVYYRNLDRLFYNSNILSHCIKYRQLVNERDDAIDAIEGYKSVCKNMYESPASAYKTPSVGDVFRLSFFNLENNRRNEHEIPKLLYKHSSKDYFSNVNILNEKNNYEPRYYVYKGYVKILKYTKKKAICSVIGTAKFMYELFSHTSFKTYTGTAATGLEKPFPQAMIVEIELGSLKSAIESSLDYREKIHGSLTLMEKEDSPIANKIFNVNYNTCIDNYGYFMHHHFRKMALLKSYDSPPVYPARYSSTEYTCMLDKLIKGEDLI